MIRFPDGFLWGAATSAYQVEGGNSNSDWWEWELRAGKTPSGKACRHYELYKEDLQQAKNLNHNAHRLSIEWSRVEPEEDKFSEPELEHYRDVLSFLNTRGIKPIVTLHHFTNPLWFTRRGGFSSRGSVSLFLRFVEKVVSKLSPYAYYWVTINEPSVYIYYSFVCGDWPPNEKSFIKALIVRRNMRLAHIAAYKAINDIYKSRGLSKPLISIAANLPAFVACRPVLKDKLGVYLRKRLFNYSFIEKLAEAGTLDYIGINYYSRTQVEVKNWWIWNLLTDVCRNNHDPRPKNSMGWDIYPEGLYSILTYLKRYGLPIMILENGICTDDDGVRWDFIEQHLKAIHRAIEEGSNVTGYIHWSLLDNFEWDKGFVPRFGLIGVDYNTYQRTVRGSALKFAQVCLTNQL